MKKLIACLMLSFLFVTGLFANSDVQFKAVLLDGSTIGVSFLPINLEIHSFLDEKQMFGVGAAVNYQKKYLNVLAGPSFSVNVGERTKFQAISGFMYLSNKKSNYEGFIPSTDIHIKNYTDSYGFAWGNDLQFKFTSDKRCSFVIGTTLSFGIGHDVKTQEAYSSNPNTTFKTVKKRLPKNYIVKQFSPYLALSINF